MFDKRMTTILAYLIMVAWALSFILDAAVKTYDPPATVHALMMTLAGAVYTRAVWKGSKDDKDESNDE